MENFAAWNYYNEIPGKDYLEKDFEEYLEANPQFRGKIKPGKTFWDTMSNKKGDLYWKPRYTAKDKYEELTSDHIYAHCSTEEIALAVEKMCQEYAKKKGILIEGSDLGRGGTSEGNFLLPIVYVTQLKPKSQKCYFCEKYYPKNRKEHIRRFHLGDAKKIAAKREDIVNKNLHVTEEGKELMTIFARMLSWYDIDTSDEE